MIGSPTTMAESPWRRVNLVFVAGFNLAGLALIAVAWLKASAEAEFSQQVSWLNAAALGVVLAGLANASLFVMGRRTVGELRRVMTPRATAVAAARQASRLGDAEPGAASTRFVATAAMTRFHRPDCLLVVGKPARASTLSRHRSAGRRPCHICAADGDVEES